MTSGGAWKGERDVVAAVLQELGWKEVFHRIRIGHGVGIDTRRSRLASRGISNTGSNTEVAAKYYSSIQMDRRIRFPHPGPWP
jgi:hypothetical protein